MNPNILKSIKHYVAGLISSAWNGGIGALAGILGIDGASMTGLSTEIHVLNWREMGAAFLGACVLHAVMWLKSHPLPETYDTNPPMSPSDK